jgi:hypothetical protein
MKPIRMLTSSKFFAINKLILKEFGLEAAVLLSELAMLQENFDNYFYRTQESLQEETSLSPKVQKKAVDILKSKGILLTKKFGMPAKLHYKIDAEILSQYIPTGETSIAEKDIQAAPKMLNKNSRNGDSLIKNINNKEFIKDIIYKYNLSILMEQRVETYLQYRKDIKKPFRSEKTIETKIKDLSIQVQKYGEMAVIESIDTAIANGWMGTFIDKKYLTTKTNNNYEQSGNKKQQEIIGFIAKVTDFEL